MTTSEGISRGGLTLLILGLLSAFGPLSTDLYLPGLPELTDYFNASASAGQLTLTACILGIAVGQLLVGPVSDSFGRRGPLLIGLLAFIAASIACALAPSIAILIGLRFLQGLAGGAGIVIATAIVRDMYTGAAAARAFAALMVAAGVAPILSPIIGAQLLRFTTWQGGFVFLAGLGVVLLVASLLRIHETLPPERRRSGGLSETLRTFGKLLRDRTFVPPALAFCLSFVALFSYIAGSPFFLENVYGLSPQEFGIVFATNALALVTAAQVSGLIVHRFGPWLLLTAGLVLAGVSGLWVLVAVLSHSGVALLLPGLLGMLAANGLIIPNSRALALADHGDVAGSASALLGVGQFGLAAVVAPLVGVAGSHSAVPTAILIVAFTGAALAVHLVFGLRPQGQDEVPAGA